MGISDGPGGGKYNPQVSFQNRRMRGDKNMGRVRVSHRPIYILLVLEVKVRYIEILHVLNKKLVLTRSNSPFFEASTGQGLWEGSSGFLDFFAITAPPSFLTLASYLLSRSAIRSFRTRRTKIKCISVRF